MAIIKLNRKVKSLILIFVLIFISFNVKAQVCNCGLYGFASEEGDKPNFTAEFKNGNKLILCGYGNYDGKETFFESEFVVYNCLGNNRPISGYSALKNCRIDFKNDTLKITELKSLAIGKKWEIKSVDYKTESFYFINDSLHHKKNKKIRFYNQLILFPTFFRWLNF